MIKGFLLFTIFLILFLRNCYLKRAYFNQREYFIKTLSHDLRVATLAQIRGIELLEKNNSPQLVNEIKGSCHYSFDMISMLLNSYRFEKGEQILNITSFNPYTVFEKAKSLAEVILKEKNIDLEVINNSKTNLFADENSILKVFSILIYICASNSFANNKIQVKLSNTSTNFICSFVYSGKVLSEEERKRMFSLNHRFSTVGYGIKLLLCRKIVDFHKGKINLNNFEDKTVIELRLPLNIAGNKLNAYPFLSSLTCNF